MKSMARWGRVCATRALPWTVLGLLNACSVTGLDDASSRFNCNAPKGVPCSSTSGVYANSVAGTLPATSASPSAASGAIEAAPLGTSMPLHARDAIETPRRVVPGAGQAIRSLPKQLRVLIFPWVDADNDLHDQAYLYMAVDPGRWLIEHTRAAIHNDAPAPRLAGAAAAEASDAAPPRAGEGGARPDADAPRPPSTLVIPGGLPQRSPRTATRVNPPLGVVEQRNEQDE